MRYISHTFVPHFTRQTIRLQFRTLLQILFSAAMNASRRATAFIYFSIRNRRQAHLS